MSALDFSEVKAGTYVKIGADTCKSISIDGVKAWEYKPAYVLYGGDPDDYEGRECSLTYNTFTGSSWTNKTVQNVADVSAYIKSGSTSYNYPCGQNNIDLRDGEYFLVFNIEMNDTQTGVTSTPVQPVTLKFNKKYKKVTIPYDYWVSEFSGIDGIGLTINFGTSSTYLDISTAEMGDVTLTSTTEADTITFAFEASGHSYVAARKISGLFVVIDSILAYTE